VLAANPGAGSGASTTGCAVAEYYQSQLSIANSQFGLFGTVEGILLENFLDGLELTNNVFDSTSAASNATFVYMVAMSNFNIANNLFTSGTTSGTYGINIQTAGYSGDVAGTIIGNVFTSHAFAIYIGGSAGNITVQGNRYLGNTTNVSDNGSSDQVWDNPVGTSAVTVGGSPWTYTASSHPETLYVRGGSVSNITVNGTQMASGTSGSQATAIQLWPNESMTITYGSTPTVNKDVH